MLIPSLFKINPTCTLCPLSQYRYSIVCGKGEIPADILFIGEAPGETENITGEPFTGRSGALLDQMLEEASTMAKLPIPKIFITNTVLCRPCYSFGGKNRQPTKKEIESCGPNLKKIISVVKPKRVMFIGKVSQANYKKIFKNEEFIYHPAFLLRGRGEKHPYYLAQIRKLCDLFIQLNKRKVLK